MRALDELAACSDAKPVVDLAALLAITPCSRVRCVDCWLGGERVCLPWNGEVFGDRDDYARSSGDVPERRPVCERVSIDREQLSYVHTYSRSGHIQVLCF